MLESYAKFAKHGEKIGRYRVEGHGSTFYSQESLVDLPTQDRVVAFLRDPQRVFALVAAYELAPLDSAFKQAQVPYYVVDGSSSRFLLLTNQLDPGQRDQNPLLKDVWLPPPGAAADARAPLDLAGPRLGDLRERHRAGRRRLSRPSSGARARSRSTSSSG